MTAAGMIAFAPIVIARMERPAAVRISSAARSAAGVPVEIGIDGQRVVAVVRRVLVVVVTGVPVSASAAACSQSPQI